MRRPTGKPSGASGQEQRLGAPSTERSEKFLKVAQYAVFRDHFNETVPYLE
jgi:hypothetical protein